MANVLEDQLYTPRRVQKCLFGPGRSSSKKSMLKIQKDSKFTGSLSGEESDLGPMSPLGLSDHSPGSCTSSPKLTLLSPKSTPKRFSLSLNVHSSWDRISPGTRRRSADETRISLKRAIQTVNHSSRKEILPDSPNSLSNSPLKNPNKRTPSKMDTNMEDAVPDTPERQFGNELQNNTIETPYTFGNSEHKLITPLTSENKAALLPRLHRRKSINILDEIENSPEKKKKGTLKRRAAEELGSSASKLLKTDENHLAPKARAALFQDKGNESCLKSITLSTKNFYSHSEPKRAYKSISEWLEQKRWRKPFYKRPYIKSYMPNATRCTGNRINAGVSHGIKKPKLRASLDSTKSNSSMEISITQQDAGTSDHEDPEKEEVAAEKSFETRNSSPARSPSPEIDLNKRFFKIKRSSKKTSSAIVTINNRVKLRVASDGTLTLNKKKSRMQACKRPKLADVCLDATDLSVDEPELEATIEQNKVANILKILEDDWANDDFDTMEILTNRMLEHISPLKPVAILNDVTMSPASELSNMTSTMNITDISTSVVVRNIPSDDSSEKTDSENTPEEPRYYPMFNKGYSSNKIFNESSKKSSHNAKESIKWQLSTKLNGDDSQYQLDAGQKNFGATQCSECGIVYQVGDPEDENAHLNYHNNRKNLKFPGWKMERVIMEDPFTSSRIILVEPADSKLCWKKVSEVLAYVDTDLGLVDTKLSDYESKKVYLYIRDKAIIGVLVAEHITTAHRMIPELLELNCCMAESSPAKCGINVVWTDLNHRRQGIATKLVDTLRAQFYFGYVMSTDDIAFSIPTVSGKMFAEKYTKTRNFKVYS